MRGPESDGRPIKRLRTSSHPQLTCVLLKLWFSFSSLNMKDISSQPVTFSNFGFVENFGLCTIYVMTPLHTHTCKNTPVQSG